MADAKPASKPALSSNDPFDLAGNIYKTHIGSPVALVMFILFVAVLGVLYWISLSDNPSVLVHTYVQHYLGPYFPAINTVCTILTMLCIVGIIYVLRKTGEVNALENRKYKSIDIEREEVEANDSRWEVVWNHLHSETPSEWRIAILEADTMLDDAMKRAGARGDTLGERLKSLDSSNFQTLQLAWDAHKVRNLIAHEGVNFQLTEREARRVIDMYQKVLAELKYI